MKEMSFVSLMNILLSNVEENSDTREATEEDIRKYFGQEEIMATSTLNIIIICATLIGIYIIDKLWKK